MMLSEKVIEKAQKDARELEKENPGCSVVWIGDNRYIIISGGKQS